MPGTSGSHFERVDDHTVVCFFVWEHSSLDLAKSIFWKISSSFPILKCSQLKPAVLIAEAKHPFELQITLTITPHPLKGFLGILQGNPTTKLSSLLSSILPLWASCKLPLQECEDWFYCKKHITEGKAQFQEQFFQRFLSAAREENLSFCPEDKSPLSLGSICLQIDTIHRAFLGRNEKIFFYIDISEAFAAQQIVIQIYSGSKIQLIYKYGEKPSAWNSDGFLVSQRRENQFHAETVLNHLCYPPLSVGRLFLRICGSSLLCKTEIAVSIASISRPDDFDLGDKYSLQVISPAVYDNEANWVLVGDESSPAGRDIKTEVISASKVNQVAPPPYEDRKDFTFTPSYDSGGLEEEIPSCFLCPLSRRFIEIPVTASDGYTYNKEEIENWLVNNHTSPVTGEPLASLYTVPNFNLKSQINEWKKSKERGDTFLL